jgi:macrolide-specific efflux system membrane fusion protein
MSRRFPEWRRGARLSAAPDRMDQKQPVPLRADPATSRRGVPRRRWPLALLLVLVAIVAAGAVWFWPGAGAQDGPATVVVERGTVEDSISALGTLQPRDFVDVGTQVSGQLRTIHVAVGDHVKQGDLLAEIDPTVYLSRVEADRAQLLNLKAQLAEREAQLVLAQHQFKRQQSLLAARATSEEAYQAAEANVASARAQIDSLKAQAQQTESTLRGNEANLGYTKIHAPMAGTVVSQTAKRGQTLNANQQAPIILRIADLSEMTVTAQVSEADIGRLRIGMDAWFTTLGRSDRRWQGKLRQILPTPEVVNNVVLYHALFDVPNEGGQLMTQMSAQVFFVAAAAENVPVVPLAALKRGKDGGWTAQVLGADGQMQERTVRVGVTNRVSAQVLGGLAEGDRVLIGKRPTATSRPAQGQGPMRMPRLS